MWDGDSVKTDDTISSTGLLNYEELNDTTDYFPDTPTDQGVVILGIEQLRQCNYMAKRHDKFEKKKKEQRDFRHELVSQDYNTAIWHPEFLICRTTKKSILKMATKIQQRAQNEQKNCPIYDFHKNLGELGLKDHHDYHTKLVTRLSESTILRCNVILDFALKIWIRADSINKWLD